MSIIIPSRKTSLCWLITGVAAGLFLIGCSASFSQIEPTLLPTQPLATLSPTPPTPTQTPFAFRENWAAAWADEFNGADRSAVDPGNWVSQTGGGGWGNGELQFYTDRTENAFISNPRGENGYLVIHAQREDYLGRKYTSARLNTRGSFEFLYGRVEARIRIPNGQGIWPAFWMLGSSKGWPAGGEIDIMENIGKEPDLVHGTIHGPGYSGGNSIGKAYSLPNGEAFFEHFHVFAVEWEPNEIRWYVDEQIFQTLTPDDLPPMTDWVFDQPFFILLNVAVGGGWPGMPDSTTGFPQQMWVDYVRVYARPDGWTSAGIRDGSLEMQTPAP